MKIEIIKTTDMVKGWRRAGIEPDSARHHEKRRFCGHSVGRRTLEDAVMDALDPAREDEVVRRKLGLPAKPAAAFVAPTSGSRELTVRESLPDMSTDEPICTVDVREHRVRVDFSR